MGVGCCCSSCLQQIKYTTLIVHGASFLDQVCTFHRGDRIGELEFIHNHRTVADVIAVGEVRAARLNRAHFELCMGSIVDLLKVYPVSYVVVTLCVCHTLCKTHPTNSLSI